MEELFCQLRVIVQQVTKLLTPSLDYNENHYQTVMVRELQNCETFNSYQISTEVVIPYQLDDGFTFGYGRADIILQNSKRCIIIELKAGVTVKHPQILKYKAQVSKYVKHYRNSRVKNGVVIVFNPSYWNREFKMVTVI